MYTLDFVSPYRLRQLTKMDEFQKTWDRPALDEAIALSNNSENIPQNVRERLTAAGYSDFKGSMELLLYRGPIESQDVDDDYVVGLVNESKVVRLHKSVFASGIRPFRTAHFIEFELEPYGYGISRLTKRIQDDLNANRNRIQDLITFALLPIWKVARTAGLRPGDLKIRPWYTIPMNDINAIAPITPDLNAVNYGLKLEELLKDDFRALTGAIPNLQAIATDVTATEARIATSEGVRRLSVMAEIVADSLFYQYLRFQHKSNMQFLDKEIWARVTGMEKPLRITPSDIQKEVDFDLILTTEKNFRPKRLQWLIQFLQILTSLRNFIPKNIDVGKIVMEIAMAFGINPREITVSQGVNDTGVEQRLAQLQALSGLISKEGALSETGVPGTNIGGNEETF